MKKIIIAFSFFLSSFYSVNAAPPHQAFNPVTWSVTGRQTIFINNPYPGINATVQITVNLSSGPIQIIQAEGPCLNAVVQPNVTILCRLKGAQLRFRASSTRNVAASGFYQIAV